MANDYPGGKGQLYQAIINRIPPHKIYIEPFAGGGAVLRNKRPARSNIAIDSDTSAIKKLACTIAKTGDSTRYEFINTDALSWLENYQANGTEFIYADPPYLLSTRRQHRRLYRCELATPEEHTKLLAIFLKKDCPIMISGYWSELYAEKLIGWRYESFAVQTRGGGWATEFLWMNYPVPDRLHDYSYLGDSFRDRERIKRKRSRWLANWNELPALEQAAILAELGYDGC